MNITTKQYLQYNKVLLLDAVLICTSCLFQIVKSDATTKINKKEQEMHFSLATPTSEYHQQKTSLYTIIDRMRCIGLRDTSEGNTPS